MKSGRLTPASLDSNSGWSVNARAPWSIEVPSPAWNPARLPNPLPVRTTGVRSDPNLLSNPTEDDPGIGTTREVKSLEAWSPHDLGSSIPKRSFVILRAPVPNLNKDESIPSLSASS